jgi:5-methylcytosine-specific restriction endonuclease McrA
MANRNPDKYREYMKEYMLKRYHDRRNKAIEKLGGSCFNCGQTKNLQFDHKDRKEKSFTIAKLSSINEKKFWEEIKKCQLLCESCHSKKTLIDLGQTSAKDTHGTLSSYRYCKCELCKKVHSDYCREWKKRKSLKDE